MRRLLVATRNRHKTAEMREILGGAWEVTDLTAYPEIQMPEETGATFAENAAIKAAAAARHFEGAVLSDDSGLEVDALDGAPGVRSARYAGDHATDAENRTRLLQELCARSVRGKGRSARFRCAMAWAEGGKLRATFEGAVEGVIIHHERGEEGFGYDSLFVPNGYCETFAQLAGEVKNTVSHRARALAEVLRWISSRGANEGYRS